MNVTVPASAPLQAYTFSVDTLGGTATSGPVTVTVTPAQSSSAVAKGQRVSPWAVNRFVIECDHGERPSGRASHTGPSFGVTKGSVLLP
jgi:hypothetical protein